MAVVYFHVKATKHPTASMEGKKKENTRWRWKHLQELVMGTKKSMFRRKQDQERLPLFFVMLSKFPFHHRKKINLKWFKYPLQNEILFFHLLQWQDPHDYSSFNLYFREMPSKVTHHGDRSPHNSLLCLMTPGWHSLMLCCWRLKSLLTILRPRRQKGPCWV